jgi:hypothetical protein
MLTQQGDLKTNSAISVVNSSSLRVVRAESCESERREYVLLAPVGTEVPSDLGRVTAGRTSHSNLLADVQRLRGRIYSEDGAIDPKTLSADGRHQQAIDDQSWHIVALSADGVVQGCIRYSPHTKEVRFEHLGAAASALSQSGNHHVRQAIENEIASAREKQVGFGEVGGWALAPALRSSTAALDMLLIAFALIERLGGSLGVSTATVRHGSASILQRMGLRPLEFEGNELPAYYDPQYQCEMQILRFDSSAPNPKYSNRLRNFQAQLSNIRVLCASKANSVSPMTFAMAA